MRGRISKLQATILVLALEDGGNLPGAAKISRSHWGPGAIIPRGPRHPEHTLKAKHSVSVSRAIRTLRGKGLVKDRILTEAGHALAVDVNNKGMGGT